MMWDCDFGCQPLAVCLERIYDRRSVIFLKWNFDLVSHSGLQQIETLTEMAFWSFRTCSFLTSPLRGSRLGCASWDCDLAWLPIIAFYVARLIGEVQFCLGGISFNLNLDHFRNSYRNVILMLLWHVCWRVWMVLVDALHSLQAAWNNTPDPEVNLRYWNASNRYPCWTEGLPTFAPWKGVQCIRTNRTEGTNMSDNSNGTNYQIDIIGL